MVETATHTHIQSFQLVSSSGDGSTLLWSPAADETLTEEKQQALERLYADAFSDDED